MISISERFLSRASGHSFGGSTVVRCLLTKDRFRCGVVLDGVSPAYLSSSVFLRFIYCERILLRS